MLVLLLLAGAACRKGAETADSATDPRARLGELLRRGGQPGELSLAERGEVEQLLAAYLPPVSGELSGYSWRVTYDDLPAGDFVSIELLHGEGEVAPRAMWFHLLWRGEPTATERAGYAKALGDFPARGVDGHHLFVRAGPVELRAVADRDDFRDAARIAAVVGAFDLEGLSRL